MRSWIFVAVLIGVSLGSGLGVRASEYDVAVNSLAFGTSSKDVRAAVLRIKSGGVGAFDCLLAHLDDGARASDDFQNAAVTVEVDGKFGPHQPTVGEVCFRLMRGQIEGVWPKGYRKYYVLNRGNIREWLGSRKGKTMHELRVECAKLALASARRDDDEKPTAWTKSCVEFLGGRVRRVEGGE